MIKSKPQLNFSHNRIILIFNVIIFYLTSQKNNHLIGSHRSKNPPSKIKSNDFRLNKNQDWNCSHNKIVLIFTIIIFVLRLKTILYIKLSHTETKNIKKRWMGINERQWVCQFICHHEEDWTTAVNYRFSIKLVHHWHYIKSFERVAGL